LETPADVDQTAGDSILEVHGNIEFIDVGFQYETREESAVRHLTFIVDAGENSCIDG
jgi:ABC-type bacteriocin/lantibiotic exporter with double-glycine peptidase domain